MRFWRKCLLFYLGGAAYYILELLWRGRSHGSMFLLGGGCFLLIGIINRRLFRLPLAMRLLICAAAITALELGTGLVVNRDFSVWDYRSLPPHYHGQICLNYSLLWIPVSMVAIMLYTLAERATESATRY